jgi:hypothetical protein
MSELFFDILLLFITNKVPIYIFFKSIFYIFSYSYKIIKSSPKINIFVFNSSKNTFLINVLHIYDFFKLLELLELFITVTICQFRNICLKL